MGRFELSKTRDKKAMVFFKYIIQLYAYSFDHLADGKMRCVLYNVFN